MIFENRCCLYFYNGTWFGDVLRGPGGDPGAVVEVGASGEYWRQKYRLFGRPICRRF